MVSTSHVFPPSVVVKSDESASLSDSVSRNELSAESRTMVVDLYSSRTLIKTPLVFIQSEEVSRLTMRRYMALAGIILAFNRRAPSLGRDRSLGRAVS